jgi:site-specific DNA-methyltransferase (adenine-specific)
MQKIPDKSVDLILTDPPYHSTKKANITGDRNFKTDTSYLEWLDNIAKEWERILAPNGSLYCFASPKMAARVEVLLNNRFNILASITWTKPNEPGYDGWKQKTKKESLRGWYLHSERIIFAEAKSNDSNELLKTPFSSFLRKIRLEAGLSTIELTELIGEYGEVNHGGAVSNWETGRNIPTVEQYRKIKEALSKFNTEGLELPDYEKIIRPFYVNSDVPYIDVWDFPTVKPYSGKHPAEKPLDLIGHIIQASSYQGNTILDCFAGSGVVGQAAKMLNRQSILIEIEEKWCEKIAIRCSNVSELTDMSKRTSKSTIDFQKDALPLFQLQETNGKR